MRLQLKHQLSCSHLKAWLSCASASKVAHPHWLMLAGNLRSLPCLLPHRPAFSVLMTATGLLQIKSSKSEHEGSQSVFYDLVSKIPPSHFCSILLATRVSTFQCGKRQCKGHKCQERWRSLATILEASSSYLELGNVEMKWESQIAFSFSKLGIG